MKMISFGDGPASRSADGMFGEDVESDLVVGDLEVV